MTGSVIPQKSSHQLKYYLTKAFLVKELEERSLEIGGSVLMVGNDGINKKLAKGHYNVLKI